MKRYTVIVIIFITVVLGFFVGFYLYKIKQIDIKNLDIASKTIEDECTEDARIYEIGMLNSKQTNYEEEKVSPNCILEIKKYYKNCNHTIQTSKLITDENLINITKEEFEKKYKDWEIREFTPKKIVIYKEINDFCNEHYVLRETNGYLAIYKLDKENKENLEMVTDITIEYLPKLDIEKIKKGIKIYTKSELNKRIQDFE